MKRFRTSVYSLFMSVKVIRYGCPSALCMTPSKCVYVSAATPFPGGFKCFTCEEAPDNYECNRWAPDLYCPQGESDH